MSPLEQFSLAAGIIGVVAFVMATTPFLQVVFGQPKIVFSFYHDDSGDDGRLIKIHLRNRPIENRLLRALKVARLVAGDVYLTLYVFNTSTKETVVRSFVPDIALFPSNKAARVSLAPSDLNASVSLARWQRSTNSAVFLGKRDIPLKQGTYAVIVTLGLDGKTKVGKPMLFHVGKTETEMMWDKNITSTLWV
jgi:hypothetical protein